MASPTLVFILAIYFYKQYLICIQRRHQKSVEPFKVWLYYNCSRTTRSNLICRCTYSQRSTTWEKKNLRSRIHEKNIIAQATEQLSPCWRIPSIINAQRVSLIHVRKNLELKTNHIFNSSLYVTCCLTILRFNCISLVSGTLCSFNKQLVITV